MRFDKMGVEVLIRELRDERVVKVELDKERSVGGLKEKLIKNLDTQIVPDFILTYKGREMSDDRKLDFYGIEEHDMLFLEKDQKGYFHPDLEAVETAREWLEENIGLAKAEVELREYSRTSSGEKEMMFEFGNEMAKLSLYEGKVEDYGLVSSKNM